jgi:3-oxoacyl-[acyl-carrier-protein] synthase II
MRRVVITGIGAITPIGQTFEETWKSLKSGVSGISLCSRCRTDDIPWKLAGEIKELDRRAYLSKKEENRLDLFVQYAFISALHAVEDSSLMPRKDTMVIVGSSRGGITGLEEALEKHLLHERPISAYLMPATTISMAPSWIARRLGLRSHTLGISHACASGTVAIGEAYRLIQDGRGDVALAGGTEAPVCRTCLEGYGRTGALSRGGDSSASRPFDRCRDGFVLSEGASMLVIEEMGHALRRGARIYAEILGYSQITVGEHQTKPVQLGEIEVMRGALKDSGVSSEEIEMINTHGTSTVAGDLV